MEERKVLALPLSMPGTASQTSEERAEGTSGSQTVCKGWRMIGAVVPFHGSPGKCSERASGGTMLQRAWDVVTAKRKRQEGWWWEEGKVEREGTTQRSHALHTAGVPNYKASPVSPNLIPMC